MVLLKDSSVSLGELSLSWNSVLLSLMALGVEASCALWLLRVLFAAGGIYLWVSFLHSFPPVPEQYSTTSYHMHRDLRLRPQTLTQTNPNLQTTNPPHSTPLLLAPRPEHIIHSSRTPRPNSDSDSLLPSPPNTNPQQRLNRLPRSLQYDFFIPRPAFFYTPFEILEEPSVPVLERSGTGSSVLDLGEEVPDSFYGGYEGGAGGNVDDFGRGGRSRRGDCGVEKGSFLEGLVLLVSN